MLHLYFIMKMEKKEEAPLHSIQPFPRDRFLSESIILTQAGETSQLSEEMRGVEEFRPQYLESIRK